MSLLTVVLCRTSRRAAAVTMSLAEQLRLPRRHLVLLSFLVSSSDLSCLPTSPSLRSFPPSCFVPCSIRSGPCFTGAVPTSPLVSAFPFCLALRPLVPFVASPVSRAPLACLRAVPCLAAGHRQARDVAELGLRPQHPAVFERRVHGHLHVRRPSAPTLRARRPLDRHLLTPPRVLLMLAAAAPPPARASSSCRSTAAAFATACALSDLRTTGPRSCTRATGRCVCGRVLCAVAVAVAVPCRTRGVSASGEASIARRVHGPALAAVRQTFKKYLSDTVLPAVKGKHETFLLMEVVKRWQHHKIMNKWMFRFFMYLVRRENPPRRRPCILTAPRPSRAPHLLSPRAAWIDSRTHPRFHCVQNRYYREHHNLPTLAEAGAQISAAPARIVLPGSLCRAPDGLTAWSSPATRCVVQAARSSGR